MQLAITDENQNIPTRSNKLQIDFKDLHQVALAEQMWNCDSAEQIQKIIDAHGVQAIIVYNMIVAQAIDDQTADDTEFQVAYDILQKLR